jgi:hypothetical protein
MLPGRPEELVHDSALGAVKSVGHAWESQRRFAIGKLFEEAGV